MTQNSLFRPFKTTISDMQSLPIQEGQFIVSTDSQEIYLDKDNLSRVKVSQVIGEVPIDSVSNIDVISGNKQATIKWTDPDDMIIEGKVLAYWAGTKLVIKEGSYPTSLYDGTLILDSKTRNQYSSNRYTITGLTNDKVYYGALFPYTVAGYVNTSTSNRFTLMPGTNFPGAATNIEILKDRTNLIFTVTFTIPSNVDNVTIVMKEGSAPNNSEDGVVIKNADSGTQFANIKKGVTYYFKIYTYNEARRETASSTVSAIIPNINTVPFSTGTDAEIAAMLDAHYNGEIDIEDYWSVGDTRKIHLNSVSNPNVDKSSYPWPAQDITIVITAMKHHDLANSINGKTKAAITCQTRETINNNTSTGENENYQIYPRLKSLLTTDNNMVWAGSSVIEMRTWMNNTFYNNALPTNLKSLIKPIQRTLQTSHTGTGTAVATDRIFLPTATEVFRKCWRWRH